MSPEDALLIVDVQRDFCPGGALPVPEGHRVVGVLNRWIDEALARGALIVASRDWHPKDHVSFVTQGGPWPVHCVQGTPGAELHPDLRLPGGAILISKGQARDRDENSAFDRTGLDALLERHGIRRVFVGGLALEVCVRATVLDAIERGLETHLVVDATRPIDATAGQLALHEMRHRGAILESVHAFTER